MTSGIKKRLLVPLKRAAGAWVEELPSVLWSLRTTPNTSTQFTPFFMVYGAEAILPSDVRFNAPRVEAYNEKDADEALEDAVDGCDSCVNLAGRQLCVLAPCCVLLRASRLHLRVVHLNLLRCMPRLLVH